MIAGPKLRRVAAADVAPPSRDAIAPDTLEQARAIVDDVKARGEAALREHATRLGDIAEGAPMIHDEAALRAALGAVTNDERALLERTAQRIRAFAEAQRACLATLSTDVPGGRAGHTVEPVDRAGCYAPGGRFPLPSSVLMTAVTARAAGVASVWVASPRPTRITLAAAAIAGADALLAVGGAHAIAALAFGAGDVPPCDAVVGPGNRWVTAAKQLIAGHVAIDMLAGPSELLVLADASADPAVIAADLLAQAEHDPDAMPILVSLDDALMDAVDLAIAAQLDGLPTADTASAAVAGGLSIRARDLDEAIALCDRLAPEHLEVMTDDAEAVGRRLRHYGGLFVGPRSAEVFGDYGAGPNHVLPTGGTARRTGGLSVFSFLRIRTWLAIDDPSARGLLDDAAALARLEGLEAHARAAEQRRR